MSDIEKLFQQYKEETAKKWISNNYPDLKIETSEYWLLHAGFIAGLNYEENNKSCFICNSSDIITSYYCNACQTSY